MPYRYLKTWNGYHWTATQPAPDGTYDGHGARSVIIIATTQEHAQILAEIYGLQLEGITLK